MTYSSKVVTSEHEYLHSTYLAYLIVTCSVPDCTPDLFSQIPTTIRMTPAKTITLFFTVTES